MPRRIGMMRTDLNRYRTRRVFNTAKALWPDVIDISDGLRVCGSTGTFPTLSRIWDEAETKAKSLGFIEIDELGDWAMFCVFHEMACKRFPHGITKIFKADIRMARFDYQIRRNLIENVWRREKELYEAANTKKRSVRFTESRKYVFSEFRPAYRDFRQ